MAHECHPNLPKDFGCGVMFPDYPEILSVDEACELLRIGRNNLYEILNNNQLKAYRNGRVWRIPKLAVQEYILEQSKIKK